jgi:pre-mRNA-splicing factor ATP-dependent RNA helicase DHX38/PRP16
MPSTSTIAAKTDRDGDARRQGLGDFQSRLNRGSYGNDRERGRDGDRERGDERYGERDGRDGRNGRDERDYRNDRRDGKGWDAAPTPRTGRAERDMDGGSMRVPNRGWDETPRGRGGWGKPESSRKGMGWDETPRSARAREARSPDGDDLGMDAKEWEEEQVRLDRDWYSYDDEGAVVSRFWSLPGGSETLTDLRQAGDEEHNPFSQWETLERDKEAELQAKAVKRQTARQAQYVCPVTARHDPA